MRNKQRAVPRVENKLSIHNTLVFICAGFGIFAILFILGFFALNLGRVENSAASTPIMAIGCSSWSSANTWDLNRKPSHRDIVIIPANKEVVISSSEWLENVTIKVYGTLILTNGKLRLDPSSTIMLASEGQIISNIGNPDQIALGNLVWKGDEINSHIIAPCQLTASGIDAVDLLEPESETEDFKGRLNKENLVVLEWASQIDKDDFFVIERSYNGIDFTEVAVIEGKRELQGRSNYSYEDNEAVEDEDGTKYYRLKQLNSEGEVKNHTISISKGTTEKSTPEQKRLTLTNSGPNPFSESFTITYNIAHSANVELSIFGLTGKMVHRETLLAKSGENTYSFNNSSDLKPGTYFVRLFSDGHAESLKMIKL